MHQAFSLLTACSLLMQPALAAAQASKAERDRQLHEIIFKNYPPRALAAGEQGAVFFTVSLDRDAHPTTCQVTHGSGHPLLDVETCQLIMLHAVFNRARDADGRVTKQTTEGVVNWTIPGREPAPIKPIALVGTAKPEPQVCKKTVRTGTVAGVERTCMTPSEWARQSDDTKEPWEAIQGRKGMTAGDQGCIAPSGC